MSRSNARAVTGAPADRPGHAAAQDRSAPAETGTRDDECAAYRLHIVALDVADAVTHVGGWLFDRSLGGWDTTVVVAACGDDRPLRILGAGMSVLDQALSRSHSGARDGRPHTLAVSTELCRRVAAVRTHVTAAIATEGIEVLLWSGAETAPPPNTAAFTHQLSIAARAFKREALTAADLPTGTITPREAFHTCPAKPGALFRQSPEKP